MRTCKIEITAENPIERLALPGDIHVGHPTGSYKHWKKALGLINKYKMYVVGMGDYVDAICHKDNRYVAEHMPDGRKTIDEQFTIIEQDLESVATMGRLLGLHDGNHEDFYNKLTQQCCIRSMVDRLNKLSPRKIQWLMMMATWSLKVNIRNQKPWIIRFKTYHGTGGGWYINTAKDLQSLVGWPDIDVVAHGHDHMLLAFQQAALYQPKEKVRLEGRDILFVHTGSFLRTYADDKEDSPSAYGEQRQFRPPTIGFPYLVLDCIHRRIVPITLNARDLDIPVIPL